MDFCKRLGQLLVFFCCACGLAGTPGLPETAQALLNAHPGKSGLYVLEKGEDALLARAWLGDHAVGSIDIQYFIWSSDNVGILASEFLLRAADRGVKVRVLVDDLLVDAPSNAMLALSAHPNFDIRIYNPKHKVGVALPMRVLNLLTQFKAANQRMHDKTAIFDRQVAVTGGRNMADEYYDYDRTYNFRDRDALVLGPVVGEMEASFERFWASPLAIPVEELLATPFRRQSPEQIQAVYGSLHAYAQNPANFAPEVREALQNVTQRFDRLTEGLVWEDIRFLCDLPGKNNRHHLHGGGRTTAELIAVLRKAKHRVTIQSPYLVLSKRGIALFQELMARGVEVRISTNSLASTDNLQAFSGYQKQRQKLLQAGIKVTEFKPDPAIKQELLTRRRESGKTVPIFSLHAKTLVVDGETLFIGTFNLDPRSANLNTEVGVLLVNAKVAAQVEKAIERDMAPENSWDPIREDPDSFVPAAKRRTLLLWKALPLTPLL
jgi:putative cardiolipin synthase